MLRFGVRFDQVQRDGTLDRARRSGPQAVAPQRRARGDVPVATVPARLGRHRRWRPDQDRRAGRRGGRLVRRGRLSEVHPLHSVRGRAALHRGARTRPARATVAAGRGTPRFGLAVADVVAEVEDAAVAGRHRFGQRGGDVLRRSRRLAPAAARRRQPRPAVALRGAPSGVPCGAARAPDQPEPRRGARPRRSRSPRRPTPDRPRDGHGTNWRSPDRSMRWPIRRRRRARW